MPTADSAEARRAGQFVQQIVQFDADLEYSLQENTYWLPARQVLSGRVTVPFGGGLAVPFEAPLQLTFACAVLAATA